MTIESLTSKNYCDRIVAACFENLDNIRQLYGNKEGAKKFTRDFAYALNDCPDVEAITDGYHDLYQRLIVETLGKKYIGRQQFYAELDQVIDWLKFLPAVTVEEIKNLPEFGSTEFTYRYDPNRHVRLSSKIKTWKRDKNRVEFSVKYGMWESWRVDNSGLHELSLKRKPIA